MKNLILILILGLGGQTLAGRQVALENPTYTLKQPSDKEKPLDQDQVSRALGFALANPSWRLTKKEGNILYATYARGDHVISVRIVTAENTYQVFLENSYRMKYKKKQNGKEFIHRGYYTWLERLHERAQMALTQMD